MTKSKPFTTQYPVLSGAFILLSILLAACTTEQAKVPVQELVVPLELYGAVEWPADHGLLLSLSDLRYFDVDEKKYVSLQLEQDPRCQRSTDFLPTGFLPDGRLGLIQLCRGRYPDRNPSYDSEAYFFAYDWQTTEVEQIVADPLPNHNLSRSGSWNPDMSRGVQALTGMFGTIYWLTPEKAEPMAVTVRHGDKAWSLDENIPILLNRDARIQLDDEKVGIARHPDWSPDGETIAFFASLAAIGREGLSRLGVEYSLYLMDPDELQPEAVLDGLYDPLGMHWSPDSRWLVLHTQRGLRRQWGLWLFSPESRELILLDDGEFRGWAWSPDGRAVVATKCVSRPDILCEAVEVLQYDVSALVADN